MIRSAKSDLAGGSVWSCRHMSRVLLVPILVLALSCLVPIMASAQGTKSRKTGSSGPEKITGKVASVEKKGRAAKLTVEKDDGEKLELNVTPKTALSVVGKGDADCLRANQMVSAEATLSNGKLFGSAFTVFVGSQPQPKFQQDPNSPMSYEVCGQVTDADKESVTLDFGGDVGVKKVLFEAAGIVVTVNSADAGLATEGAPVEMEGNIRAGKFLPTKITVTLDKGLTADEVYSTTKTKAVTKKTAAKPARTKVAKSTEDAPADEPAGEAADPFGVIKKKGPVGKKSKAAKPDPDE